MRCSASASSSSSWCCFIWAYFREWKMSVGALVALAHDVIITVGIYALSGFEVTPATVTGILTILGFSLYDTVVVFDKVRENTRNLARSHQTYGEAANLAVNQTLVRSINTSIVALLPVGALLYVGVVTLGSGALKDLALALFVGMAAGLYSSVFIATPLVVQLKEMEPGVKAGDARARRHSKRKEADRFANVPAFSEDMPIMDEPSAPRSDVPEADEEPERGAGRGHHSGPQPLHGGRAAGRPPGGTLGGRQACAAGAQAPVAARQEVTDDLGRTLDALIRDVPDFPEPGVVFKDITPLLADHDGFSAVVDGPGGRGTGRRPATSSSTRWSAWRRAASSSPHRSRWRCGAGFVPVRKAGKLPGRTHAVSYALEYGEATLEVHRDAISAGERVLLVDDVLATGGTAAATRELVEQCGGAVVGFAVLMELGFLAGQVRPGRPAVCTSSRRV